MTMKPKQAQKKDFKCLICEMSFATKSSLKKHRNTEYHKQQSYLDGMKNDKPNEKTIMPYEPENYVM